MILDVGCGGSFEQQFMPSTWNSNVQLDIRKPIEKRENFVLASAEAMPFRDGVFHLAESFDVLEHVDSPVQMMREMRRVAKRILLLTPNSLHLPCSLMSIVRKSSCYEPHHDHVCVWSKAEMIGLLNRVGFPKYEVSFTDGYGVKQHTHDAHWYIRLLMLFIPFQALRYRALLVTAENN